MKLPRNLDAQDLVLALSRLGYKVSRQTGSHIRLTATRDGEHHLTVPNHSPLRAGTLSAILRDVAEHQGCDRDELLSRLFG